MADAHSSAKLVLLCASGKGGAMISAGCGHTLSVPDCSLHRCSSLGLHYRVISINLVQPKRIILTIGGFRVWGAPELVGLTVSGFQSGCRIWG